MLRRRRPGASADILRGVKRILLYGLASGLLITLLKVIEFKHFLRAYPSELYGGLLALIFSALGIYFGRRWAAARPVPELPVGAGSLDVAATPAAPFVADADALKRLGLTPREHEILGLIAEGLSNREIGERLFVSENTVKTHSSRLFEKLAVNRRVQAVRRAQELGLLPEPGSTKG